LELLGVSDRAYWKKIVLDETEKTLHYLDQQELKRLSDKAALKDLMVKEELTLQMNKMQKIQSSKRISRGQRTKAKDDPFRCQGFEPQHFDSRACQNCNNVQYAHTLITKQIN